LGALIAFLLPLAVFTPGQEQEDASNLWQQVSQHSPQQLSFFDTTWFAHLLAEPSHNVADKAQPPTGTVMPTATQIAEIVCFIVK